MTALGWLLLTLMAAALTASLAFNWWQSRQLDQLHGTHASSRPRSVFPAARPGTTLLSPAQAAAHADAMHEISAPYVPVHDRTVQPRRTPDSPPWEDPGAVAAEQLQQQRAAFARQVLGGVPDSATTGELQMVMAGLMDELGAMGPVYGQAPVAEVLKGEQERGAA